MKTIKSKLYKKITKEELHNVFGGNGEAKSTTAVVQLSGPSAAVEHDLMVLSAGNCACSCSCTGTGSGSGSGSGGGFSIFDLLSLISMFIK